MTRVADASAHSARAIIDAGRYMTLATADADGIPWASPVWYAPAGYSELLWVSHPDMRHSRNLAARPQLAIVIFDSTVTPGEGQGVYMAGIGEQLGGEPPDAAVRTFSDRSVAQGLGVFGAEEVQPPAGLRLYRARISEHWMLGSERDERVPVNPQHP